MDIRIADTFTSSLARLTGEEQKAAKITVFDLQADPSAPGLQFHRIGKSKDRHFWSLRAGRDLRIIVHKTSGSVLVCYVDHHDKAYGWAERRRIEAHPRTGTIQIVEVRERVDEIVLPQPVVPMPPAAAEPPLPFAGLADDRLLDAGVPDDWLGTIRGASEDEFLVVAEHLPPEAAEALLEFAATGMFPVRSMEAVARPEAEISATVREPALDFAASRDTARRFRVIENVAELEAAFAFPWERWTVFLHPSQREVVERQFSGPARVAGSAGTGKTVVALHRAARLAGAAEDAHILLTTFSQPLATALERKLRILLGDRPGIVPKITVAPFRGIAEELYQLAFGHRPQVASEEQVGRALSRAVEATGKSEFSPRFLVSEWSHVVDAWQIGSAKAYADVPRIGRKSRLGTQQRERLWPIFAAAREDLRRRHLKTWAQIFDEVTAFYTARLEKPFTQIVVDEAQDLGVPELRFLAGIAPAGSDALFFAGDLGQRIFQQPFSWKALGVDVRGRSQTLRVNYRTSHQIRSAADRLLPKAVQDVDGLVEERSGTVSVFNGPEPKVELVADADAEAAGVARWLGETVGDGIDPSEIGIFVRTRDQLARARQAIAGAGLDAFELSERDEDSGARVSVGTMQLAKGLEFRAVVVMACDESLLPLATRIEAVADEVELDDVYETERQLLYVACTRARDHLLICGVEPGSEFVSDLTDTRSPQLKDEFYDVPTDGTHGSKICFADVVYWILSLQIVDSNADPEDVEQPVKQMLIEQCQKEKLHCFGYEADELGEPKSDRLAIIPADEWVSLEVSLEGGQPGKDRELHGWRPYGEALRYSVSNSSLARTMYVGLCFGKEEIAKSWPPLPSKKRHTVAAEQRAIDTLAKRLNAEPDLLRSHAVEICRKEGISKLGALQRVWPQARQKAGLATHGKAGRKRKN